MPTAPVVSIRAYRHTRELRVDCPYCAEEHSHGLGWGTWSRVTSRLSHCGRGDYEIVIPASAAGLVQPTGYRSRGQ